MHTKDLQQLAIRMLHDDYFSIEYIMFITGYSKAELASILYNLVEEEPKPKILKIKYKVQLMCSEMLGLFELNLN